MVINTIIWHNPKCSKSRQALRYLNQKDTNPVIRLYLKNPPTISELEKVLLLLNLRTLELTRTKEVEFKALPSNIINDDNLLIKALNVKKGLSVCLQNGKMSLYIQCCMHDNFMLCKQKENTFVRI